MPGLSDFEDFISPLIESQFPNVYKDVISNRYPKTPFSVSKYFEIKKKTPKENSTTEKDRAPTRDFL